MKNKDLERVRNYFKKNKLIKLVYLYGSQAREETTKDSDIDLAILVEEKNKKNISSDIQLKAMSDLEQLLDREIEVQNLNVCKTTFAYRVISEGKIIYERSENERVEFEEEVIRNYFDMKPFLEEFSEQIAYLARTGQINARPFSY